MMKMRTRVILLALALTPAVLPTLSQADIRPGVTPRQDELSINTYYGLGTPISYGMTSHIKGGKNGVVRELSDFVDALGLDPIRDPRPINLNVYDRNDPARVIYQLFIAFKSDDEIELLTGTRDPNSSIKDGIRIFGKTAQPFVDLMKATYQKNKTLLSVKNENGGVTYTARYITCIEPASPGKSNCELKLFRADPTEKKDEFKVGTRANETLTNGLLAKLVSESGGLVHELSTYVELTKPSPNTFDITVDSSDPAHKLYKLNLSIGSDQEFAAESGRSGTNWFFLNDGLDVKGATAEPFFNLLLATHAKDSSLVSINRELTATTLRGKQIICYDLFGRPDPNKHEYVCTLDVLH